MKNKITASGICLFLVSTFIFLLTDCSKNDTNISNGTITDIDGNLYHTVTIGTQVWLVENLKTTKYRNGDPIPNVMDNGTWQNLKSGAYCNYNNDAIIGKEYGYLYNWYAVNDSRRIAPSGWHVASDAEWTKLTDFLNGENVAGGKLKENGITHWSSPNTNATNESGFTALAGGYRDLDGKSQNLSLLAILWTSSEDSPGHAWDRLMYFNSGVIARELSNPGYEGSGASIRCVKD